jgi:hypothetical protein
MNETPGTITLQELAEQLARFQGEEIHNAAGLALALFTGAAHARDGMQRPPRASKGRAA